MATGIYLIDNPPVRSQYRHPRRERPSGVIVVHTAESFPDETGPDTGAENVAAFIQRRTTPGSYHDLADSDSTIRMVRYTDEAFGDATGSNPHAYHVSAATQAAKWDQLGEQWVRQCVRNMAASAAAYTMWLRSAYDITIPAKRITRAQSEKRLPGFISHAERDPARRTDPGAGFPWNQLLDDYTTIMEGDDMELTDKLHAIKRPDTGAAQTHTVEQALNAAAWLYYHFAGVQPYESEGIRNYAADVGYANMRPRRMLEYIWGAVNTNAVQNGSLAQYLNDQMLALKQDLLNAIAGQPTQNLEAVQAAAKAGAEEALTEGIDLRVTVDDQES